MSETHLPPVVAIHGCTGVGKTGFAIDAALSFNGEIVNADSRYLYRGLTIGVAKPTPEELEKVRHHLIDVFEPTEHVSISLVQRMAYDAIDDIAGRGKLPVVVGGTPLYMNSILEGWRMPEVPPDWPFRHAMEERLVDEGLESLAAELAVVDPVAAERSTKNPRRVIRALEVFHVTGKPMSSLETKVPPPYRILNLALHRERAALYESLDRRVDQQIADGLVDEVESLLAQGLSGAEPAFSSIGYRQLLPYLQGDGSLEDAANHIKTDTHRYVRHQTTWLRRKSDLVWLDTDTAGWHDKAIALISKHTANGT